MEEKVLVIKYNQLGMMVDVCLYARNKIGLVLLTDMIISNENWEIAKSHIDAEYINLDKEELKQYNTAIEGDDNDA